MSLVNYLQLADRTDGFFIPSVTLVGPGCVKEVGPRAKMLGAKRALIVTDAGLHKMGLSQEIADLLRSEGIDSVIFAGAEPNPTDINVHDGVKVYQKEKCDFIVSLGGGSSHDCAKGIGLVTAGGAYPRLRRSRQVQGADDAADRHQHHCRYRLGNDPLLHHHQYRYPRENGHRRLALYPVGSDR